MPQAICVNTCQYIDQTEISVKALVFLMKY
jgi:hypothetical protein